MIKSERNPGLTGLRGLLVWMTALGYHYEILFWVNPASTAVGKFVFGVAYVFGLTAPNLFFVMSGYLMYSRYRGKIRGEMRFSDYILPKVKKLYPLMIMTTLYLFILGNVENRLFGHYPLQYPGEELRYTWKALILNVLGLQSGIFAEGDEISTNAASWYIAILMICYVLFFFIVKSCKNKKVEYAVYMILGTVGMFCSYYPFSFPFLYRSAGRGLGYFFSGVFICIYMEEMQKRKKEKMLYITTVLVAVAGLAIMIGNPTQMQLWPVFFAEPAIVCLLINSSLLQKIFSFSPLVWAGNRSLYIFLGNMPILMTFIWMERWLDWRVDYTKWVTWLVLNLLTVAVTQLLYLAFEKDRLFAKKNLEQNLRKG